MKQNESDSMFAARQAAKFRAAGDFHNAAAWDAICLRRNRALERKPPMSRRSNDMLAARSVDAGPTLQILPSGAGDS